MLNCIDGKNVRVEDVWPSSTVAFELKGMSSSCDGGGEKEEFKLSTLASVRRDVDEEEVENEPRETCAGSRLWLA